tara:strand:+ start:540 stop:2324 length:1785 start_codon:yes stop_codon:yes gene_type:complete
MGSILTPSGQGAQKIGAATSQAAKTPYQKFQVDQDMFGGGGKALLQAGKDISKFGVDLANIAQQEREEKSTIKKMELEGAFNTEASKQKLLYGDKKLGNAEGAAKEYKDNMAAHIAKMSMDGLTKTDAARMKLFTLKQSNNGFDSATEYERKERTQHIIASATSRADSYSAAVQGDYKNEGLYGDGVKAINSSEELIGKRLQRTKEETDSVVQDKISAMNIGRIKRALSLGDTAYARKIFEEGKKNGSIDGDDFEAIQSSIKTSSVKEESRAETRIILNTKNITETEAIKRAGDIKNVDVSDAAVTRIRNNFADQRRIADTNRKEKKRESWKIVMEGGSVDDLAPEQLASVDGTTISSMRAFEKKRAQTGAGFASQTMPADSNRLHRMFQDNRKKFLEYDLTNEVGKLEEDDYNYWLRMQSTISKEDEKSKAKLASYTMADKLAKEYMNEADIGYGQSASNKDSAKANKIYGVIRGMVDTAYEAGKPITRQEIDTALSGMFLSGEFEDGGFSYDPDGRKFEFRGMESDGTFKIEDEGSQKVNIGKASGVPVDELQPIFDAINKNSNLEMTIQNIQDLWAKNPKSTAKPKTTSGK